jgi:hypothetical protein
VKGVVHYAMGDKEKGNKSMESATRTTAVVGAGVLTGMIHVFDLFVYFSITRELYLYLIFLQVV